MGAGVLSLLLMPIPPRLPFFPPAPHIIASPQLIVKGFLIAFFDSPPIFPIPGPRFWGLFCCLFLIVYPFKRSHSGLCPDPFFEGRPRILRMRKRGSHTIRCWQLIGKHKHRTPAPNIAVLNEIRVVVICRFAC